MLFPRKIGEGFYGVCHWNPGSSETSISLLLTAQPRSELTFSFFPSAHLISACLPLFFIPRSYLQRNASLSLSLSIALCSSLWIPLLWFPLSFSRFYSFFVLEAADHFLLYSVLVRVKAGFYWTLTQTCILQQCHRLKIRTCQIILIYPITFADRIP